MLVLHIIALILVLLYNLYIIYVNIKKKMKHPLDKPILIILISSVYYMFWIIVDSSNIKEEGLTFIEVISMIIMFYAIATVYISNNETTKKLLTFL